MFNTAFSYTKSKFNKWPIIYTDDMFDYSQADAYAETNKYVWFVNPKYKTVEHFNWGWLPPSETEHNVHTFPRCFKETKRPVNWQIVKLVPTAKNRLTEQVRQPIIASYNYNEYPVYFYSFNDTRAVRKFSTFNKPDCYCQLIKTKSSIKELFEDTLYNIKETHVWFINVDVKLNDDFDFEFKPDNDTTIYMWQLTSNVTNKTSARDSVMLVPKDYLIALQMDTDYPITYKTVNTVAGTINEMSDPIKAWGYAFINTYTALVNNTELTTVSETVNLHNYILSGVESAKDYYNSATDKLAELETIQNWDWLTVQFANRKQQDAVDVVKLKRLNRIEKVFGKDSDEYKYELERIQPVS